MTDCDDLRRRINYLEKALAREKNRQALLTNIVKPRICPLCERLLCGEIPAFDGPVCSPLSGCPAWTVEAAFDHETREWLTVDPEGYVLDGRHYRDVK